MAYGDWTRENVGDAIQKAMDARKSGVTLSMEHNSRANELQVVKWVEEFGHTAELEMERCVISFKNEKAKYDQLTDEDVVESFERLLLEYYENKDHDTEVECMNLKQEILRRM